MINVALICGLLLGLVVGMTFGFSLARTNMLRVVTYVFEQMRRDFEILDDEDDIK